MQKLSLLTIFTGLLFFLVPPVIAQTNVASPSTSVDINVTQKVKTQQSLEVKENICVRVTQRVQNRVSFYESAQEKWGHVYQGVISRLKNLTQKLDAKGCDTTQVKTDITAFEKLIAEYASLFKDFMAATRQVQTYSCQADATGRQTAFAAARQKHQLAKTKRQEIRLFYQQTLRPDVKALNQTCRALLSPKPKVLVSPQPSPAANINQ